MAGSLARLPGLVARSTPNPRVWTRSLSGEATKGIFFDMKHSNNAARIRLWLRKKGDSVTSKIERRVLTYPELRTPEFAAVNPLKKVPAFILPDGTCVFESQVILQYLEEKYGDVGPVFSPPTPEGRQVRSHFTSQALVLQRCASLRH